MGSSDEWQRSNFASYQKEELSKEEGQYSEKQCDKNSLRFSKAKIDGACHYNR
jgi:hypothetical protein